MKLGIVYYERSPRNREFMNSRKDDVRELRLLRGLYCALTRKHFGMPSANASVQSDYNTDKKIRFRYCVVHREEDEIGIYVFISSTRTGHLNTGTA